MKNLICIVILFMAATMIGQNYYVISIDGEIFAGEQLLAPKDRLTPETQLRFVDAESSAYLMSPSKGYFVLSAKDSYPAAGKEFLVAVKNALLPPSELKNTAIRATYSKEQHILLEDVYDVLSFFRGDLLYLDTLTFELDPEFLPAEDTRVEWFSTNGQDTLRRDLEVVDQRFIMHWSEELHDTSDAWQHQILCHPWYQEDELEPYTFRFSTPKPDQLHNELQALQEVLGAEMSESFLLEYAVPYVNMRFGKVHPEQLRDKL